MSDESQGPGWWLASDGRWYPPEQSPGVGTPAAPQTPTPQATAPQWSAPGPPPQKSSSSRTILIVIAVIFVLVAGGCVAVLFAGGLVLNEAADQIEDELRENDATAEGRDDAGTRDDPLRLGTEVDLGNGWRVTVNSVDLDATDAVLDDGFSPAPTDGMRYVVVDVTTVFDVSDGLSPDDLLTESPMFAVGFVAYGSDDVERTPPGNGAQPPEPALAAFSAFEEGGEATGNILLEVGEDESDLVLKVAPGLSLGETEAWYALEPG